MFKLLHKISRFKKILLTVPIVGIILTLIPAYSAQAISNPFDFLGKIFDLLGGGLAWMLAWPLILVMFGFLLAGVGLSFASFYSSLAFLKWVTSGYLVTLPFTRGGIVDAGWQASQGFANLAFVLILAFIAIATILRLDSYGLKKLLPKFLIAIILINFSKIIAGGIIDIANVITNSLLPDFNTFLGMFNPFSADIANVQGLINGNFNDLFLEVQSLLSVSMLAQRFLSYLLIIFFGLFSSLIFFTYFVLFAARYIVVWLLVIVSPIAWALSVLPETQKYYKMWWNYFIQWAFVGAIGSFFLNLGANAISRLTEAGGFGNVSSPCLGEMVGGACEGQPAIVSIFSGLFTAINSITMSVAVIFFLIMGFIISVKTSKSGTDIIMKAAQRGGAAAGKVIRDRALAGTKSAFKDNNKYLGRIMGQYRGDVKNAKGFRKKAWAATLGGLTAPAKVLRKDYNDSIVEQQLKSTKKTGKIYDYSKKEAVAEAIYKTGPLGRMVATHYAAASDAMAAYRDARKNKANRLSATWQAVKEGGKTAPTNSVSKGIWDALKEAKNKGWAAATKKKQKKKFKVGDSTVEFEEVEEEKKEEKKT
jgi:hypothetical protein